GAAAWTRPCPSRASSRRPSRWIRACTGSASRSYNARTATPDRPGWRFRFAVGVAASDPRDVLRRGALGALDHVELDAVALGQRLEPAALDGAVMDEAVLRAVLARDEPEALGLVEPLHGSPGTHSLL